MKKLTITMGQYFQSKIYDLIKELKKPSSATMKLKRELVECEIPKVTLKELDRACTETAKEIKEEILKSISGLGEVENGSGDIFPEVGGKDRDISIEELRKRLKNAESSGKLVIDFKKVSGNIKIWESSDLSVFGMTMWDSAKWDFFKRKTNRGRGSGRGSGVGSETGIWSRGIGNTEWIDYITGRVLKRFFKDDPWIGKITGKPSKEKLIGRVLEYNKEGGGAGGNGRNRSFEGVKVVSAVRHKKGISSIVLDAVGFLSERISGGVRREYKYGYGDEMRNRYGYKVGEGKVEFYDKLRGAGTGAGGGYRKGSVVATLEDKGLREYRNWVNRSRGESIRSTLSMKFHMDNVMRSIEVRDYRGK